MVKAKVFIVYGGVLLVQKFIYNIRLAITEFFSSSYKHFGHNFSLEIQKGGPKIV